MLQWMLHESVFPWLPLASFFLIAVFLGRTLCGWVCPFGFVQDLLEYVKRKHIELSMRTHEGMTRIKYVILAITLLVSGTLAISLATGVGQGYKAALGAFAPGPFNALSPADTLFARGSLGLPKPIQLPRFEERSFEMHKGGMPHLCGGLSNEGSHFGFAMGEVQ